ncbi:MAG: hypothetical protein KF745_14775 [Phycisphaeraceae bacterium]|nr:hypothetical protein [Phycisphaeraceae bacterium]
MRTVHQGVLVMIGAVVAGLIAGCCASDSERAAPDEVARLRAELADFRNESGFATTRLVGEIETLKAVVRERPTFDPAPVASAVKELTERVAQGQREMTEQQQRGLQGLGAQVDASRRELSERIERESEAIRRRLEENERAVDRRTDDARREIIARAERLSEEIRARRDAAAARKAEADCKKEETKGGDDRIDRLWVGFGLGLLLVTALWLLVPFGDESPSEAVRKLTEHPEVRATTDAELLKSLSGEAGNWARHYSTVRMTVTPFLIGLAASIMSFAWDRRNAVLLFTSLGVWLTAAFLFQRFSMREFRASSRQKVFQRKLIGDAETKPPGFDWARGVMCVLTLAFGFAWWAWSQSPRPLPKPPPPPVEVGKN